MSKKPRPCCDKCGQPLPVKYNRTIDSKMAMGLVALVVIHEKAGDWVHVSHPGLGRLTSGGDFARLRHWGLIQARPNTDSRKKSASGYWRPTDLGVAFAKGRETVPYVAKLRKRELLGLNDTKRRHIQEALGKEFILADLLAGAIFAVTATGRDNDE
jgi:hypothetical protein